MRKALMAGANRDDVAETYANLGWLGMNGEGEGRNKSPELPKSGNCQIKDRDPNVRHGGVDAGEALESEL
jgi:hypothetical protein